MTDHPCKGMTKPQIEAFEEIAIGNALPVTFRGTIRVLENRGLIERTADKILQDELGKYPLPQYQVPIPYHMQWCQWCSEQPESQE